MRRDAKKYICRGGAGPRPSSRGAGGTGRRKGGPYNSATNFA
jgi:hypothetical protein